MSKEISHTSHSKSIVKNFFHKVLHFLHLDCLKHERPFWLSFFIISFLFVAVLPLGISTVFAADDTGTGIVLLEDYGGLDDKLQEAIKGSDSSLVLAEYINMIVKISFGLGSIGAVILIVWGGIEYITAQTFSKKSGGKDKLVRAIGALVILFTSFILFNQLNPELLKVRFKPLVTVNTVNCTGFACGAFGAGAKVNPENELIEEINTLQQGSQYQDFRWSEIPFGSNCLSQGVARMDISLAVCENFLGKAPERNNTGVTVKCCANPKGDPLIITTPQDSVNITQSSVCEFKNKDGTYYEPEKYFVESKEGEDDGEELCNTELDKRTDLDDYYCSCSN